jgi:rhamnogalacturonyl hydrolase YesR
METLTAVITLMAVLTPVSLTADTSYLGTALDAARWIQASADYSDQGKVWRADPRDARSVNETLYSGNPGIVLFFIEAYRSTGNQDLLKEARDGADHLLAVFSREKESGLYEGIAGIGFALTEAFKATGNENYRQGAWQCAALLALRARKAGNGIEWNDTTDIIAGGAGIGLFLLYAAHELNDPKLRDLAVADGRRLIELGLSEQGGMKWRMSPTFSRLMPNFSHGTAGISYFLATLYQETKRREFLEAALAGAKYLQAVAKTDGDACLIFHNEPDGRDLYYLGWCHGPVGTARLFYRLYQVTGDRQWMDWVRKSARGIMASGIPDRQTPGFWNNVSQCCGSAGVAEFFLSLYRITHDQRYMDFSKRVTMQLLDKGTRESIGIHWIQAEHRIKPDLLVAQTGYMQGAAGIGMLFLHLDQFSARQEAVDHLSGLAVLIKPRIILPANAHLLIDEFMPVYDVSEYHETRIRAEIERVYDALWSVDLGRSRIVRALLRVRALPAMFTKGAKRDLNLNLEGLLKSGGFVLLGEARPNEIALGLIGQFWRFSGGTCSIPANEFTAFDKPGFAKAVWNFSLIEAGEGRARLATETRVLCLDEASRRRFRIYWGVIAPFSALIRREVLCTIRREAERAASVN